MCSTLSEGVRRPALKSWSTATTQRCPTGEHHGLLFESVGHRLIPVSSQRPFTWFIPTGWLERSTVARNGQ